jgi:L-lactate dehydrogenase complex protein LldG
MSARDRILASVDAALARRRPLDHPGALPRDPRDLGSDRTLVIERFAAALTRSGGEVVLLSSVDQARMWVATFARRFASMAASPEVPTFLRPALREIEPALAELGVSVAVAAAAATGSLVLDSREGRRLQLLPPVHLVWVDAGKVSADLGTTLEGVRATALPAVLAPHSGPSKSADIGRIVVTGVHGPGRLVAAVVADLDAETSNASGA